MENIRVLILVLTFVSFIGGLNWFITAIRNMNKNSETMDIFNDWISQKWVNWIYIFIFLCNITLFVLLLFPQIMNKTISTV
tara:strand:- start:1937 stop:2179 length:243 start_codon:yes stop_codon:yes gene_type:complete